MGNYITSGANPYGIGSEVHVDLTAELSPSPTDAVFDSDGEWQTFAVSTNADSLFVTVNGPGSDVVIEIAGGSVPPPRNYCGPEPSDSPSSARRNGWNLHLAGCVEGATQVVLMDYVSRDTLIVYDVTVGQTQREDEDDGSDSSIPTGEKLYWVRWGRLYRANLDGTNVEAIIDGNWANISSWASIDRSRGKIYWYDLDQYTIIKANLDGTSPEEVPMKRKPELYRYTFNSMFFDFEHNRAYVSGIDSLYYTNLSTGLETTLFRETSSEVTSRGV